MYLESQRNALAFGPDDVKHLVEKINNVFDLPENSGLVLVPCMSEEKVRARFYPDDTKVRSGEYILYNPDWLHEVTGGRSTDIDKAEGVFIFSHEIGHYLGRHFTAKKNMERYDKELQADGFAACASAKLDVPWGDVEAAIRRFWSSRSMGDYPSSGETLDYAEGEYEKCANESVDPDFGQNPQPPLGRFPSGTLMQACGCWGPNLMPVPEPRCAAGYVQAMQCPGYCPLGGFPYSYICQ